MLDIIETQKLACLIKAIRSGNIEEVRQLLQQKLALDFNPTQVLEVAPLAIAISCLLEVNSPWEDSPKKFNASAEDYLTIIRLLLEAGAPVQNTYLQQVILHQQQLFNTNTEPELIFQVSKWLLQHGADPNLTNKNGWSLLLEALNHKDAALATLLLGYGADPMTLTPDYRTALHIASQAGLEALVAQLIECAPALLHGLDNNQRSALDFASSPAVILKLLQHGVKPQQKNLIDFFLIAEQTADLPLREYLFQQNIIHYQTPQGENLLHHVTAPAILLQLIKSGVNVKAVSQATGMTPLLHCVQQVGFSDKKQVLELITHLLARGANILDADTQGNTVFHHIATGTFNLDRRSFNVDIMDYLQRQGALLNSQNQRGETPLMLALEYRHVAVQAWLLAVGVDMELQDLEGQRAVEYLTINHFCCNDQAELIVASNIAYKLLEFSAKKGELANATSLLCAAAWRDDCRLADAILAHYPVSHKQLYELFLVTCNHRNSKFKTWLLQRLPLEYKPQITDKTLLQLAVYHRYLDAVSELLERGADPMVLDLEQNNLLQLYLSRLTNANSFSASEQRACLDLLIILRQKVNLQHRNSDGYNALGLLVAYINHRLPSVWFLARRLIFCNINLPRDKGSLRLLVTTAVRCGDVKCLAHMLQSDAALKPYLLNWATLQAVDMANIKVLATLLGLGLDINAELAYDDQPMRLLEYVQLQALNDQARAEPWIKLLEYLLKQPELNVNFPYRQLNSALLHTACQMGWFPIVDLLLQAPYQIAVDFRTAGNKAQTPLQLAIKHSHNDIARLLIQQGADVEIKRAKTGQNLLHKACRQSNLDLVKLLLEHGFDINASYRPNSGLLHGIDLTPLYCALLPSNKKTICWSLVDLLIERGARLDAITLNWILKASSEVQSWQSLLAKATLEDVLLMVPLHQAVIKESLELVYFLLQQPYANDLLHSRGRAGKTVLHWAAACKNLDIYHLLIQQGADPQALDYNGLSVATYALFNDNLALCGFTAPAQLNLPSFQRCRQEFLWLPELAFRQDKEFQAAHYAYKLVRLLGDSEAVKQYLTTHRPSKSKRPLHDICLFSLPSSEQWTSQAWAVLAQQHGHELTQYLHLAPRIETLLGRVPQTLQEVQEQAKLIKYNREQEDLELAHWCTQYHVPEPAFERVLATYSPKQIDKLPNLYVEGSEFDKPGYYLRKLAPQDKRGFVLGAMTHCCQSIGSAGETCAMHGMTSIYGGFYVIFKRPKNAKTLAKLISQLRQATTYNEFLQHIPDKHQKRKYAAYQARFYKQLTDSELRQQLLKELEQDYEGEIVAQSWTWLGQGNELVFDSWERLRPENDELCSIMLGEAARQAVTNYDYPKVLLGTSGQTPEDLPYSQVEQTIIPQDYLGYRDSKHLLLLAEQASPTLNATKKTQLLSQRSAMFYSSAQCIFKGYNSQEFNQLLQRLHGNTLAFTCLDVIELSSDAPRLDELKQAKTSQQAHIYVIPVHKTDNSWACFILQHYESMEDQTTINMAAYYLDPTGASLPSFFSNFFPAYGKYKPLALLRAEYVKDTRYTGPWLIAILNNYGLTGQLNIPAALDYQHLLVVQRKSLVETTVLTSNIAQRL